MPDKIDLGAFSWFGNGYLTHSKDIKFYVGANIAPDEDNDIYLTADNFDCLAKEATRIANELRGLTLRALDLRPTGAQAGEGSTGASQ